MVNRFWQRHKGNTREITVILTNAVAAGHPHAKEWLSIHDVKQFEPSCVPMSMQDYSTVTLERVWHSFTIGSSNLPLDMPKWNENSCLCINQYMDIYRIFIHNCSKMETIQASFNLWMDKQAIVYLCSGPCSANSWDVQLHGWRSVHSSKWRKADLKAMCWRVQFLRHSE